MRTNYSFGRDLEYQVKAELEGYEYFVIRSSGSKGPVDLVAFRRPEILFIQCKRTGTLSPKEWNRLGALACKEGAIPLLVSKKSSGVGNLYWRLIGEKIARKPAQMEGWTPRAPGQGTFLEQWSKAR